MDVGLMQIHTFVEALASKAPVPGGGGASASVAAIGLALGHMVGSLTTGKLKYADVEADILLCNARAEALEQRFLALADQDAAVFAPLARAYGLPADTPEQRATKDAVMEAALDAASGVPLELMRCCCEAIALVEQYAAKGAAIAISDAGVGAAFLKAALQGASLNVFINTKSMRNRTRAALLDQQANDMLLVYLPRADAVFAGVRARLEA